jgi:hypothetical protein
MAFIVDAKETSVGADSARFLIFRIKIYVLIKRLASITVSKLNQNDISIQLHRRNRNL